MNIWTESLINGFELYLKVLPIMIIITAFIIFVIKSKIKILHFIGIQALVLYLICLIEVVLFPLPSTEKIATLHGYEGQFIPFNFLLDIAEDRTVESVLQVLLNILMTVPFGFFFKFFINIKRKNKHHYNDIHSLTYDRACTAYRSVLYISRFIQAL